MVAEHGWPDDLTELPGVGPYTAAAVGSFAWDAQVAAVDTNVAPRARAPRRRARRAAALAGARAELLPPGRAADFNQAMMELGATVCRPRAPRCGDVPGRAPAAPRTPPAVRRRRRARRGAARFEDTDRWARGRIVAALVARRAAARGSSRERRERALAGLERDGLVVARTATATFATRRSARPTTRLS